LDVNFPLPPFFRKVLTGVNILSIIPCTENCRHQRDGMCVLCRTVNQGDNAAPNERCLNFSPRSNQDGDRLSDIADLN